MGNPLCLDLFGGEGGAARGYMDAGFVVVSVDISHKALQRNPAATWHDSWERGLKLFASMATLIHASPPCQVYSTTRHVNCRVDEYPDLVEPVREALVATGKPYVIENVPGAPLNDPVTLCGSMFGLVSYWPEPQQQKWVELRRHRLFETSWGYTSDLECDHRYPAMPVYGHGVGGNRVTLKGPGQARVCREVMGIDWMSRRGLDEAIPPAYTRHVGEAFLTSMQRSQDEEAA